MRLGRRPDTLLIASISEMKMSRSFDINRALNLKVPVAHDCLLFISHGKVFNTALIKTLYRYPMAFIQSISETTPVRFVIRVVEYILL